MRTSELVREESSTRRIEPARTPTGIKTILLHIQNDANLEARLQVALSLARANGAHLRCLHVTPIEAYVTADTLGGVFVMEAASVIIQVASFKTTGRRVFKMAPLHHHFELIGWSEPKVITRFVIVAIIFALFSLTTLKLR